MNRPHVNSTSDREVVLTAVKKDSRGSSRRSYRLNTGTLARARAPEGGPRRWAWRRPRWARRGSPARGRPRARRRGGAWAGRRSARAARGGARSSGRAGSLTRYGAVRHIFEMARCFYTNTALRARSMDCTITPSGLIERRRAVLTAVKIVGHGPDRSVADHHRSCDLDRAGRAGRFALDALVGITFVSLRFQFSYEPGPFLGPFIDLII